PAAAVTGPEHGPGGVEAIDLAGQHLDHGAAARDVHAHGADADVLVAGRDPVGRVGQVVGRDQAVGGGVADVGHRAARGPQRPAPRNLDRGPTLVTDLLEPGRPTPAASAAALPRAGARPGLASPAQATI